MNNENLESELLDEELSDFFNDETVKEEPKVEEIKEEIKEVVTEVPQEHVVVQPEPVALPKKEEVDRNKIIEEMMGTFNVKQDYSKITSIRDAREVKEKIQNIRNNLNSLKSVYGEEVTAKLKILLENEDEIEKLIEEMIQLREEMLMRMRALERAAREASADEEIKRAMMRFIAMHPEIDTLLIYIVVNDMVERRNERLQEGEAGGEGPTTKAPEEPLLDPNAFAAGYVTAAAIANLNQDDVNKYLESFYKKVALIEKYTGVKLDEEFIQFFSSPQYILSSSCELPPLMKEDNFDKLKDTWSMPLLVNDTREEEMDKELYKANESIKSMENFYSSNYGDAKDNGVIDALKGLSNDVEEEKKRVNQDIEFFKNEKVKEKVEVAILASIDNKTHQDPKIGTLSQLLKESISSRVDYMKDEENLRKERKNISQDKTNKDNEANHEDYFDALQGVNKAIEERREKRAQGYVSFIPEAVKVNRAVKRDAEKNSEMQKVDNSIANQDLSIGGRQKVLTYVNNYNNINNIAA